MKTGSKKYDPRTLTPVQVGQVVKAFVLMGAKKITVEETEKDRFVVTTTTESAPSKKPNYLYHERNVKSRWQN